MSSQEVMDLEDLTPRQLRKMVTRLMRARLPRSEKTEEEKEKEDRESDEAKESLADLMAEKKNTNTPKVSKDDLPKEAKSDDDEDEDD